MESTRVTYPQGDTSAAGQVVLRQPMPDRDEIAVVTDVTCFHPVDSTWPDQPADRGTLAGVEVIDCLTGAIGPEGQLEIGDQIPARRGDSDWSWVVVHVLPKSQSPAVGDEVTLQVDEDFRYELSVAHTACHLAALALNQACAPEWRKDPGRRDPLGNPDLDGMAIQRSEITPFKSVDTYRLGKSIRKKGLNSQDLLDRLPELGPLITEQVQAWIEAGAGVTVTADGDGSLAARRMWRCDLPDGVAEYPCGGTHVGNLSELPGPVSIVYERTLDGFDAVLDIEASRSAG